MCSAGGHRAGLTPSPPAWEGTGSSESTPAFTRISAPHVWDCSRRANAHPCGCGLCVRVLKPVMCVVQTQVRGSGGGRAGGQPYLCCLHEGLQPAGGSFCSCRTQGAAGAGLVAAFHLPQPAVGAGSVLLPTLLPCPWHTSSMREAQVLSLAALLCSHPALCHVPPKGQNAPQNHCTRHPNQKPDPGPGGARKKPASLSPGFSASMDIAVMGLFGLEDII